MPKPFLDISMVGEPIPTRGKDEIRFNCPYCQDDKYHLYVNTKKNVYHCFKCGLAGKTNIAGSNMQEIHLLNRPHSNPTYSALKLPPAYKDFLTPTAMKFLLKRGVYDQDVKRHLIYCASPHSKYFGRLIFPYNPLANHCTYFVARAYTSLLYPKYLNPAGSKDVVFFGPGLPDDNHPQYWNYDEVVLVEGVFDMIKCNRHGPAGAILGKELKPSQARIIAATFRKVYVLMDQDTRMSFTSLKIKDLLKAHCEVEIMYLPKDKKDAGEMDPHDFEEMFT